MADLSEDFKYQKVEKEKCEAMSNECMIIKTGETFDTSIGRRKQPLKDGNQRMVLANDKSVGHLDLTLNVAHELGVSIFSRLFSSVNIDDSCRFSMPGVFFIRIKTLYTGGTPMGTQGHPVISLFSMPTIQTSSCVRT